MSYAYEALGPALIKSEPVPTNGQAANLAATAFDPRENELTIPVPKVLDPRLVALADPQGRIAEQFRALSTRLHLMRGQRQLRKLLVTSPVPRDGKTLMAANLSLTLAQSNGRVLLIGGDLREAGLNRLFEIDALPGLGNAVQGERFWSKCLYRLESPSLSIMPGGTATDHPLSLLQSSRIEDLMKTLVDSFDWIIIDSPPVLPFADADVWGRMCDGTLLVVRHGNTPKPDLEEAVESLKACPVLGVLFNDCEARGRKYYSHYQMPATAMAVNI